MADSLQVTAKWYEDMWIAVSEDIPGLVTEASTLEELSESLETVIPELLRENSHLVERKNSPVVLNASRELPVTSQAGDCSKRSKEIPVREGHLFKRRCKGSHTVRSRTEASSWFPRSKKRHTANKILKRAGPDKAFRFSHSRAAPTDR